MTMSTHEFINVRLVSKLPIITLDMLFYRISIVGMIFIGSQCSEASSCNLDRGYCITLCKGISCNCWYFTFRASKSNLSTYAMKSLSYGFLNTHYRLAQLMHLATRSDCSLAL